MPKPFENAPEMGKKFQLIRLPKQPDKLDYNPPRKVWDKNRVMAPTPMGTIDVDVVKQLDQNAQRAIHQAKHQPDEFEQRMMKRLDQARKQNRGPKK